MLATREGIKKIALEEAKRKIEDERLRIEEARLAREGYLPSFLRKRTIEHARTAKRLAIRYRNEERYKSFSSYRTGLKKARKHFQNEYTIKRKLLGKYHEETLAALNNVATCHRKAGNMKSAVRVYKKVLLFKKESCENGKQSSACTCRFNRMEIFFNPHPNNKMKAASYAISIVNLGNTLQNQYKILEAMDCYDHALPILECSLDGGKMHPFVGTTLLNDALCRIDRARKGDIDIAISKIARVIGIFEKYYGLDSTRAQEAIELLRRAKTRRANL